jgi:hypothetical protein
MDELEELLRLAETGEVLTSVELSYDEEKVRSFVYILQIVSGTNPIPALRIYEAYEAWAKGEALPYIVFFREFDKIFPFKRSKSHKYYRLKPEPLGLHPQYTIWKDRMLQKDINAKSKKRTKTI